ncbi:putative ribonuclease H-like domain-containing protein [Tanacetum coccineum]
MTIRSRTTTNTDGTSTLTIPGPVTTEEKFQKKNDVMAIPNEHQLTFNQYKDAKTLFASIQTRFGGNDATKKTQKTLLKQIQLAILGENISQEDLNLKFLKILPSEWNTYVVVWKNKPDLDSMSFDDLYNNFKIVEQEVKRTVTSSLNSGTANSIVNIDSTLDSTANLSDATVYAFLANQLNGSQLVHEDLEQIHEDNLEEIDLKCDTVGYDKSKVECFNCHKMGYFARECKGPRNQESRARNQDSLRRTVNVEDISSKAIVAIDGAGFDWSYMTDEEVPTNLALMAFSDSEFNLATYKRGLASLEEQLVFYKKNEVMLCDQIAVLKRDASFKDSEINALNIQIEKLKKEKEINQIKIDNFENASKSLDKLIGLICTPTIDLSNSGLKEFQQPEFEGYGFKANKGVCENSSNEIKKTTNSPIIEDWVSDCDEDDYEVMMVQKPVLNNVKKGTSQREVRPVWNNAMRVNHQNFSNSRRNFVPATVLTKSGIVSVSAARPINTATPKSFINFVNTAKGNRVTSVVGEQGINVVKSSACWADSSLELKGVGTTQQMVINSPCLIDKKELAIPGQTTTVNDREQQLTVTVDGQTIAITEASVRRHLQLVDADGISSLPNTEIFDRLTLMGISTNVITRTTFQVPITEPITDSFTTSHPTPTLSPMPNEPPLGEGNISRSGESSMQLLELMELCTKLSDKVTSLEDDLK